jgi:ABC-2 type transport system permease protein
MTGSARRLSSILWKEFRQIRRDPLSLTLLIFVPALLLILYGYALSFDVMHIRTAALDLDRTAESRSLLTSLFENPYFDRAPDLAAMRDADRVLGRGSAKAVVIVPKGYAKSLSRGEEAKVQALVDAADANTAGAVIGYLEALSARATLAAQRDLFASAGGRFSIPTVSLEPRVWFNPELESAHFLIPGLIGMLLMLSAVIATSLSIVREKERETMEQVMVSPIKPLELIVGKTAPYVIICLATVVLILALGYVLFGVVVKGSFVTLAAAVLLFLFAALGMGVLISSVTRSQQVSFQLAIMTSLLPSMILSGFIFPIENMPKAIQAVTYLVVPRYFVSALREIILRGAPFSAVLPQFAGMLVIGLVFNALAVVSTRKAV